MAKAVRHTYPSGTQDQFNLRLPDGLRDRIKTAADDNGRSMNAEIIAALLEAYPEPVEDIRPVVLLLRHLNGAERDADFFARLQTVNEAFARANAPCRAIASAAGTVTIETDR